MTSGKGHAGSGFTREALSGRRSLVLITSPLAPALFKDSGINNVLTPLSRLPLYSQQCPNVSFFLFFFSTYSASKWEGCPAFEGRLLLLQSLLTSVKLLTSWLQRMPRTEGRWQISGRELLLSKQPPQVQQNEQPALVREECCCRAGGSSQRNPR